MKEWWEDVKAKKNDMRKSEGKKLTWEKSEGDKEWEEKKGGRNGTNWENGEEEKERDKKCETKRMRWEKGEEEEKEQEEKKTNMRKVKCKRRRNSSNNKMYENICAFGTHIWQRLFLRIGNGFICVFFKSFFLL